MVNGIERTERAAEEFSLIVMVSERVNQPRRIGSSAVLRVLDSAVEVRNYSSNLESVVGAEAVDRPLGML